MVNKINKSNLHKFPLSFGEIPTSYLVSMSYEEQLLYLCKKSDEIIDFINDILEEKINDYIMEKFNDIMLDTMYDSENETLILYLTQESEG